MVEFCSHHRIPYEICGKLIVATDSEEAARLDELLTRGIANGLEGLRLLAREAMLEFEPHAGGVRSLYVPSTGITDYAVVASKYAEIAAGRGARGENGRGRGGILPGYRWSHSPDSGGRFFFSLCGELRGGFIATAWRGWRGMIRE